MIPKSIQNQNLVLNISVDIVSQDGIEILQRE
jgi:hypothetical protein